jgi:hypothetical protein
MPRCCCLTRLGPAKRMMEQNTPAPDLQSPSKTTSHSPHVYCISRVWVLQPFTGPVDSRMISSGSTVISSRGRTVLWMRFRRLCVATLPISSSG